MRFSKGDSFLQKPKGTNKEKKPSKVKGTSNAKEESPEEEQLKKLKVITDYDVL